MPLEGRWGKWTPKSGKIQRRRCQNERGSVRKVHEGVPRGIGENGNGREHIVTGGSPIRPNSLTRAFQDIVRYLSQQGVSLNSLRHAHATILLWQDVHPKIVQERLGHSSISTILDIYSHVVLGLQQAAAQRFDDGLPNTSLQDLNKKVVENIIGKMSAISEILLLEDVLR